MNGGFFSRINKVCLTPFPSSVIVTVQMFRLGAVKGTRIFFLSVGSETNGHGYFRCLATIIFSAHLTTFWAKATACRYSFLVTGSAGPGYRVSTAY